MVKSFEEIYVIAYTRERGYLADGKFMQMMRLSSGSFFLKKKWLKVSGIPRNQAGDGIRAAGAGTGRDRLGTLPAEGYLTLTYRLWGIV